jgi:hypothetical protein
MDIDARFEDLWKSIPDFQLPEPKPKYCVYAHHFWEWATQLTTGVAKNPNVVAVNRAKITLMDKYFEWRNSVSRSHRDRLGNTSHTCIYQVFVDAHDQLRVVELSLTPPPLYLPEAIEEAEPDEVTGIFIGENEYQPKASSKDDKEERDNGSG